MNTIEKMINRMNKDDRVIHRFFYNVLGKESYIKAMFGISLVKKKASRLQKISPGIGIYGAIIMAEEWYENRKGE